MDDSDFWRIRSRSGFLPASYLDGEVPTQPPEFDPHAALASSLPREDLVVRIAELPLLDVEVVSGDSAPSYKRSNAVVITDTQQAQRVFQLLSFLTNAFVHSTRRKNPIDTSPVMMPMQQNSFVRSSPVTRKVSIPTSLGLPLCRLAGVVGQRPALDYASCVLMNFSISLNDTLPPRDDPSLISFFSARVSFTFTKTPQERWFYAVHMAIEYTSSVAVRAVCDASVTLAAAQLVSRAPSASDGERKTALHHVLSHMSKFELSDDAPTAAAARPALGASCALLTATLTMAASALQRVVVLLSQMDEGCDPTAFYDVVRPWLSGYSSVGGVVFEGVRVGDSSREEEYAGASGAQSALMPLMDAFLGVKYGTAPSGDATSHLAKSGVGKFIAMLQSYRWHMPKTHRDQLVAVEARPTARDALAAVEEAAGYDVGMLKDVIAAKMAYNECILAILNFRKKHVDFATRYVRKPAHAMSPLVLDGSSVKGTGGSDFSTFLAKFVNDTRRCLYPI